MCYDIGGSDIGGSDIGGFLATLEALSKKDIGGQATFEAYPSRGVRKTFPRMEHPFV